jgi:flagellar operon protein
VPHPHAFNVPVQRSAKKESASFKEVLAKKQQELKISKHAEARLHERDIHINESQWEMIGQKINEAKQKGITDSLVVIKDAALLVSTTNNTVITALSREEANSRIFTNINGAILMNE